MREPMLDAQRGCVFAWSRGGRLGYHQHMKFKQVLAAFRTEFRRVADSFTKLYRMIEEMDAMALHMLGTLLGGFWSD
jgi:hypothetical protein